MAVTSQTFGAEIGDTDFEPSFPFLRAGDLTVQFSNGLSTVAVDFTVPQVGLVRLDEPLAASGSIIITRNTDIETPIVDWADGSAWKAADKDRDTLQALYSLQELNNRFDDLVSTINEDDLVLTPPVNNDRMLISVGGAWVEHTKAGVLSWLDIESNDSIIPAPSFNVGSPDPLPTFLIGWSDDDTNTGDPVYELRSLQQTKEILGITTLESDVANLDGLPAPIAGNSVLITNAGGTAWIQVRADNATQLPQLMGLASFVGLTASTIPTSGQVPRMTTFGGATAYPAARGDLITGLAKPGFAQFHSLYTQRFCGSGSTWVDAVDALNPWVKTDDALLADIEYPTGQTFATIDGPTGHVRLTAGLYRLRAETALQVPNSAVTCDVQGMLGIWDTQPATDRLIGAGSYAWAGRQSGGTIYSFTSPLSAEAFLRVPNGETALIKVAVLTLGGTSPSSNVFETRYRSGADSTTSTAAVLFVERLADL